MVVPENDYIELRYIMNLTLQKLRLHIHRVLKNIKPYRPLLIDIALSVKSGCSYYYKLLRKSKNLSNNMVLREQKWHTELNTIISFTFWEKARNLCASIKYENPLKWLQFQIIRNYLQTNFVVSHFLQGVNPECQYCLISNETISHIFLETDEDNDGLLQVPQVFDLLVQAG